MVCSSLHSSFLHRQPAELSVQGRLAQPPRAHAPCRACGARRPRCQRGAGTPGAGPCCAAPCAAGSTSWAGTASAAGAAGVLARGPPRHPSQSKKHSGVMESYPGQAARHNPAAGTVRGTELAWAAWSGLPGVICGVTKGSKLGMLTARPQPIKQERIKCHKGTAAHDPCFVVCVVIQKFILPL